MTVSEDMSEPRHEDISIQGVMVKRNNESIDLPVHSGIFMEDLL